MSTPWLPASFAHPLLVPVAPTFHVRPIRASDVDLDLPVVNRNRAILWRMYGEAWGWPSRELDRDEDRDDLARHEAEAIAHEAFNYAVLTTAEDRLLGCVYIDPAAPPTGADGLPRAEVSWWMDADAPDAWREQLDEFVSRWIASAWPFGEVTMPFQSLWSRDAQ